MSRKTSTPGGPRVRQDKPASPLQQIIQQQEVQQSFDPKSFDIFISGQGIEITHLKAIPDPTGMIDIGDSHASSQPRSSSDGFKYIEAGKLTALFSSNSMYGNTDALGYLQNSTAYMTMPRFYTSCPDEAVIVSPYDKFYLADIEVKVVGRQFVEANYTGIDRLQYPAVCVEYVIDAKGNEYKENVDFKINEDGHIVWTGQRRPGYNEESRKGTVYSVRYRYTPYFIVNRLLHEIRVSQITDPVSYERKLERMPYQVEVMRENIFHDQNAQKEDRQQANDDRFQYAPPVAGKFGPK
jgi:hypothetical protein